MIRCAALIACCVEAQAASVRAKAPVAASRSEAGVVYASIDECYISKLLNESECCRAFANANGEFLEKAPRFKDRRSCEMVFGSCSITITGRNTAKGAAPGTGVEYVPQFGRVKILVISREQREALPVLTSGPAGAPFQPRSVFLNDAGVSPARALAAREAWRKALAPPPPPKQAARPIWSAPGSGKTSKPAEDITAEPTGPVQTYPVSGNRWNDMKSRIRRHNEGAPAPSH